MLILVVNCGSSSLKASVVDASAGAHLSSTKVGRLREGGHEEALEEVLPALVGDREIGGVGHRVVHGGEAFTAPTLLDDSVVDRLAALEPLAPLHVPANVAGIRAARKLLPDVPQVAVFDTAFHATLPRRARTYAIDTAVAKEHGIRRYGFHGTSHEYVARAAAAHLGEALVDLRIVTCHLGNGCSMAAVEGGHSVETSMGMTPLEGLVMGTRSGDVDPGALLHLLRNGMAVEQLDDLLNERSGLAGLSGVGNDLRDIEERAGRGDEGCRLALQVFAHRARKYVGAYCAVMGGADAIVFTGGIGENSALIRHRIAQRLDFLGARLDEDANRAAAVDADRPVADISRPNSRVKLLVVATDEERAIARHAARTIQGLDQPKARRTIPIAVSARHIHLTEAAVETLFGAGHRLTPLKELSQPGQFACEETLKVVGPKRTIEGVRVLGPTRPKNQVEISRTDEFFLGLDAPVRQSGHVENTPGVKLVGPAGELHLTEGVICAWRHIHMTPDDAVHFGVEDKDVVEVRIDGGPRDLTFGDVLVRVSPKYALEMHVDTDEANAAEIDSGATGMLEPAVGEAIILRRT